MEHVCTSSSFLCFRQVDSPHEQKKKKINKKKKENKISTQEIFAQSATQRLQVTAEKMIGLQDDAYAAGRGGGWSICLSVQTQDQGRLIQQNY